MTPTILEPAWLFRKTRGGSASAPDKLLLIYNDENKYHGLTLPLVHDPTLALRTRAHKRTQQGVVTRWFYTGRIRNSVFYIRVEPQVVVGGLKITPCQWSIPVVLCDDPAALNINRWLSQLNQPVVI